MEPTLEHALVGIKAYRSKEPISRIQPDQGGGLLKHYGIVESDLSPMHRSKFTMTNSVL